MRLLLTYISFIITAGKESNDGGKIIKQELHTYPDGALYAMQEKAWMSENLMLMWVEKVLKPYVATAPPGITPLLFLDSFGVHKMGSVNRAINDLGVEVIIIPPGCTGLTQPVDVGYNKPFKGLIRDKYEEWMIKESEDLTKPPRRVDIAHWIVKSEQEMSATTLRNAWMRHDLEYFPCGSTVVSENVNVNDVSVSTVPENVNVNDVSAMVSDGGTVVSDISMWTDGDGDDTNSDGDGDTDLDANMESNGGHVEAI